MLFRVKGLLVACLGNLSLAGLAQAQAAAPASIPDPTPSRTPTAAGFRAPWPTPVDAIVGVVGFKIVPRSLLVAYRTAFEPSLPPTVALGRLIDDGLLATEARRYALAADTGQLEAMRIAHPLPEGFTRSEWEGILLDRALARRFLEFRFGEFVPVARDEIRALIQVHSEEFKGTVEANEAKARTLLLPATRSRREALFRAELRGRVPVRTVREAIPPE